MRTGSSVSVTAPAMSLAPFCGATALGSSHYSPAAYPHRALGVTSSRMPPLLPACLWCPTPTLIASVQGVPPLLIL